LDFFHYLFQAASDDIEDPEMKRALILGASSITGYPLAKHLMQQTDWKVTGVQRKRHEHTHDQGGRYDIIFADLADFNDLKLKLAKKLRKVTHVFYTAWTPGGSPEDELKDNKMMFENVLRILVDAPKLKHVYLQTGTKYYGNNLGPKKGYVTPSREDDPRLDTPMFYYPLEDALVEAAEKKGWRYSILRPTTIIGYTTGTAMNFGMSVAIYACIMKELGKPLIWPFSRKSYNALREFVDGNLIVDMIGWMINPENYHAHDEAFNITNGDCIRMSQLWPIIADYFGMEVAFTEKGSRMKFSFVEFMRDKGDVWNRVVKKHRLQHLDLDRLVTWQFLQDTLSRNWDELTLCNKAYSFGFNKRMDTARCLYDFFDGLQNVKIIPTFERRVELPYLKKTTLVEKKRVAPTGSPAQTSVQQH